MPIAPANMPPLPLDVDTPIAAVKVPPTSLDRAMAVSVAKVQPPPLDAAQEMRNVRALIEAAFAPLERRLRDLQTRIDELERLQASAPLVAAPAPVARVYAAPRQYVVSGPELDVAAIERTVKLDPDMDIFDGRRRRVRLAISVAVGLVVVFGGLFAALAESYTHAHP